MGALEVPFRQQRAGELLTDKEKARSYHGYSAGTAFSAARSTTVTDAATATAATTVHADDADDA